VTAAENPFPGLRTFGRDRARYFFGRDREITELLDRLSVSRRAAIIGSSGCGKSSLVFAGLVPALERGFLSGRSHGWRVVEMKPGARPIQALARAFSSEPDRVAEIDRRLRQSTYGLTDIITQAAQASADEKRLLLITDQFEELFTFAEIDQSTKSVSERAHFVELLLNASAQPAIPVYWLLTMRTEFLGRCGEYAGLAGTLNASQYLVPNLTREERRVAVEGPLEELDVQLTFAPILVQRLLNDSADERDQLPLLQHCLMRLFDIWNARDPRPGEIDLAAYKDVRSIDGALNDHGKRLYHGLTTPQQTVARRVFRAITRLSEEGVAVRRPTRRSDLEKVIGTFTPVDLRAVLDTFASPASSFITVSDDPDPEINLTHECLARKWNLLGEWIKEEAESVAALRELQRRAARNAYLLFGELKEFRRRRAADEWSAAWAARTGTFVDYAAIERFLASSEKRNRGLMATLVVAALVIAGLVAGLAVQRYEVARSNGLLADYALAEKKARLERDLRSEELKEAKTIAEQAIGNEAERRAAVSRVGDLERLLKKSEEQALSATAAFQRTLESSNAYVKQGQDLKQTAANTAAVQGRLRESPLSEKDLQGRIERLQQEKDDNARAAEAINAKANIEIANLQQDNAKLRDELKKTSAPQPDPPLVQLLVLEQDANQQVQVPGAGTVAVFAGDIKQMDGAVSELYLYANTSGAMLPTTRSLLDGAQRARVCADNGFKEAGTATGNDLYWCFHVSKSEVRTKGNQTFQAVRLGSRRYRLTVTGYVVNTIGKERLSLMIRSE